MLVFFVSPHLKQLVFKIFPLVMRVARKLLLETSRTGEVGQTNLRRSDVQPRSHGKSNHNILNLSAKSVRGQTQKLWSFIKTNQRVNKETLYTCATKVFNDDYVPYDIKL